MALFECEDEALEYLNPCPDLLPDVQSADAAVALYPAGGIAPGGA